MAFDAFLVPHDRGTDRRWSRLSVPERWCAVFGVEAIASKAPERGCLLIAEGVAAEPEDFAAQAGEGVTVAVARSTVRKMRDLGLIVRHDDGVEVIADWHDRQRDPRHKPSDSREARRARKAAQRERERLEAEAAALVTPSGHADVTRDTGRDMSRGHATEVKGREEKGKQQPPQPPASGGRRRDLARFVAESTAWHKDNPPGDDERERWTNAVGTLGRRFGETAAHFLANVHLHPSPNGRLVLATKNPSACREMLQLVIDKHEPGIFEATVGSHEFVACAYGGAS